MKQRILQHMKRALPMMQRMTSGFLAFVFCAYLALDVLPPDAKAADIASGTRSTR